MTIPAQNLLLARFADQPVLLDQNSGPLVASLLGTMAADPRFADLTMQASVGDEFWTELGDWGTANLRPYVVVNGVLQIPVKGVLLNDFPYTFFGYATGYDYIWRAFQRGMADSNVKGIALVIDSPGGMVAGCFDSTDKAIALKGEAGKPVAAFAAESAYSAAYAWACVGDTITVSRTGGVGSIGVVTMHVDYSSALERSGVVITYIHAGKHKVDGNPYQALPADVKARIQSRIDDLYAIFVDHVAAARGMDADAVRATEALCFTASEAKSNGLADDIGALDDALAAFAADLSPPSEGDDTMSTQDNSAANATAENSAVPAVDAAQVAAEAATQARQAERQRIAAITGCEEAKERPALAAHLAHNTDATVEDAKAMLAVAGKETAPEAATPFSQHMDASDQPNVGASASGEQQDEEADEAGNVVAMASRLGIKGFAKKS